MIDSTPDQEPVNADSRTARSTGSSIEGVSSIRRRSLDVDLTARPAATETRPSPPSAVSASATRAADRAHIAIGVLVLLLALGAASIAYRSLMSRTSLPPGPQQGFSRFASATAPGGSESPPAGASCGLPLTAVSGTTDGRLPLQADVSAFQTSDIDAFIEIGKEAARTGREHDAESAFLMSCRIADQLAGADSLEAVRAKYQLSALYGQLAVSGTTAGEAATRQLLIRRASRLYADALRLSAVHADLHGGHADLARQASLPVTKAIVHLPVPGTSGAEGTAGSIDAAADLDRSTAEASTEPSADEAITPPDRASPEPLAVSAAPAAKPHKRAVKRVARRAAPAIKVFSAGMKTNFDEMFRGQ